MKRILFLFLVFAVPLPPLASAVTTSWQINPQGQLRLISSYDVAPSSGPLLFGLHFKMKPGWHTYYKDPGDAGYPPKIIWEGSRGFKNPELLFPEPIRTRLPGNVLMIGYEKEVVYPIRAERTSGPVHAVAKVSYLTCGETCVPYTYTFMLDVPSGPTAQKDPEIIALMSSFPAVAGGESRQTVGRHDGSPTGALGDDRHVGLWGILLLAFVGGILLNVMPCVLPVLSIKLLGLLQQGGQSRFRIARDALASAAGILVSFLALAGAAVIAKAAGKAVGWGIQFQEPLLLFSSSSF